MTIVSEPPMSNILRTPERRFDNLAGFPFAPHYLEDLLGTKGARVHYVDEGPATSSEVFLCLHGEPSWSYLYRKMIPIFTKKGCRVIAPDLIGFGRSDKLLNKSDYCFDFHRNMLLEFVRRLDLTNITLVCQDWGGVIGLTIPMEMPHRFSRLIVMNTALATGDLKFNFPFLLWWLWAKLHPDLDVGRVMKFSEPRLSKEEVAAYDAPFPEKKYKVAAHVFPSLVPIRYHDPGAEISRKARVWWQTQWNGRAFMAIGKKDPVLGTAVMTPLQKIIRGCSEPLEVNAGHFVQERGEIVAEKALEYFGL